MAALRTPLQRLLACLKFTLDSEDWFCRYQQKKVISTNYGDGDHENYGDEWGMTWYLRWGIYTSTSAWTHSQNSVAATAAEALSLKISSHGTSLNWSQRLS